MFQKVVEHDVISLFLEEEGESEYDCGVSWIGIILHRHPKHFAATKERVRLSLGEKKPFCINSLHFLGATKHLYNWLCPSVGPLVGQLVCR